MSVQMCCETYERPNGASVICTFLAGHTAEHSFRTLRLEDEEERFRREQFGTQVTGLLQSVYEGRLDAYLEAILAACHERKRVRRGVWSPGAPR